MRCWSLRTPPTHCNARTASNVYVNLLGACSSTSALCTNGISGGGISSLDDSASMSAEFAILPRNTRMVHAPMAMPRSSTLSLGTADPGTLRRGTGPGPGSVCTRSNTRCDAADMRRGRVRTQSRGRRCRNGNRCAFSRANVSSVCSSAHGRVVFSVEAFHVQNVHHYDASFQNDMQGCTTRNEGGRPIP